MRVVIILIMLLFRFSPTVYAWGKTGHDAVAYIAECNLSPEAKKTIEKYLNHSIVYYASWMDEYRSTPEYKHTSVWHGAAVDEICTIRMRSEGKRGMWFVSWKMQ